MYFMLKHETFEQNNKQFLHQIAEMNQIHKPKQMNPKMPSVNPYLRDIIIHDRIVQAVPEDTISAFELFGSTSLCDEHLRSKWPSCLVATQDYLFAVKSATGKEHDDYLRPVNWVVKLNKVRELILIGPTEVQELLPKLRESTVATLLVYSVKTTKEMRSFDKLDVYSIPEQVPPVVVDPNVLTCLRVFAGQLYFSTFDEYERFCVLLGLPCNTRARPATEQQGRTAEMLRLSNKTGTSKPSFVPMVKRWIAMRRKGIEWAHTHVGRVLNGINLDARDFV